MICTTDDFCIPAHEFIAELNTFELPEKKNVISAVNIFFLTNYYIYI